MPPSLEQFRAREVTDLEGAVFEEVDGRMMATVRILKAGRSKNNRLYPPALVQEAVDKQLFNGIQMFIDHNRAKPNPQDRGLGEMVSAIESTSYDSSAQAMDGRVEFFDRNFYERAQRAQKYMGVSINALVRGTRRVERGVTYEDVSAWVKPRTVDWVTTPAAGGAILAFEDEEDDDMPAAIDWTQVTAEEVKKNAAAVYEAIKAEAAEEAKKDDPPAAPTAPVDVAKAVQEAVAQYDADRREEAKKRASISNQVKAAFEKSGLPPKTQDRLVASFESLDEFDEEAVGKAITEAQEELKAAGAQGPQIEGMGPSGGSGDGAGAKTFSIHESVASTFGIVKATKKEEGKE